MRGDLLALKVALAPCVIGYAEIATRLASRPDAHAATNPYRIWIAEYAGAPGMTKEVTFEPVDGPINDRIDHAYRAKYRQPVPQPHDRRARSLRDPKQTSAST